MTVAAHPRYRVKKAKTDSDMAAAQALRSLCFKLSKRTDADAFDVKCIHLLIEDRTTKELLCCFRAMPLVGAEIAQSYSAQFYDLSRLAAFDGPMLELGRFCIAPHCKDPDVLRLAWATLTRYVDTQAVRILFGCSSFDGTDTTAYLDAFALLKARYLAPAHWMPQVKAPDVIRFSTPFRSRPDLKEAMRVMPPLLRSYLVMGGWVSDHAVVDRDMNTLHVFTGVEVAAIPVARQRSLRAIT
jgi:putative hemolysin